MPADRFESTTPDAEIERLRIALGQADLELALRSARIDGLERLVAQGEQVGNDAVSRIVTLLRELGFDAPSEIPGWQLPDLVTQLSNHLVAARNQFGELVKEVHRLAGSTHSLETERDDLLERVRQLNADAARVRGSAAGPTDPELSARRPLRILMVVHDFLPRHAAGAEICAWRLAKALREHHRVHLLFTEAHPGVHSYRLREGEYDGLPFTEISHQHVARSLEQSYSDERIDALFRQTLGKVQPDVVHIQHLHHLSLGVVPVAKQAGIPIVYTLHDYALVCPNGGRMLRANHERCTAPDPVTCAGCIEGIELREVTSDDSPIERTLRRLLPDGVRELIEGFAPRAATPSKPQITIADREDAIRRRLEVVRAAAADVDRFLATSRFVQDTLVNSGIVSGDRIAVSENGQDPSSFRGFIRRASSDLRVGYIGTLVPHKGVHVLVEALNELADLSDLTGAIHGGLDVDPTYARRLVEANRNSRVAFGGRYDPHQVRDVLANLDVIVVPSLWWECAPLTIQEAFLGGVVPIVSGIGGMAEFVKDEVDGLHVPPGDAKAIARQIRRLHADRALLTRLAAARPLVRSIQDAAADVEAVYRTVIAARARPLASTPLADPAGPRVRTSPQEPRRMRRKS